MPIEAQSRHCLHPSVSVDWKLCQKVIKAAFAYMIASILCIVPQVQPHLGVVAYLVPLGTIYFHSAMTLGSQLEQIVLNIIMLVPSAIYCGVIGYLCTLYNAARESHPGLYSNGACVIAGISFFLDVAFFAGIRIKYPRFFLASLQAFVVPFFALTRQVLSSQYDISFLFGIIYPLLIGAAIALLVNIVLWPETANKNLEKSISDCLKANSDLLSFLHNDFVARDVDLKLGMQQFANLKQKLRISMDAMARARVGATYEFVLGKYDPTDLETIAKCLRRLSENSLGISTDTTLRIRPGHDVTGEGLRRRRTPSAALYQDEDSHKEEKKLEYAILGKLLLTTSPHVRSLVASCSQVLDTLIVRLADREAIPLRDASSLLERERQILSPQVDLQLNLSKALSEFGKSEKSIIASMESDNISVPIEDHSLVFAVIFAVVEVTKQIKTVAALEQSLEHREHYPGNDGIASATRIMFDSMRDETSENTTEGIENGTVTEGLHQAVGRRWYNKVALNVNEFVGYDYVHYAVKFGAAMTILAIPAWFLIEGLNTWYNNNHGQWALLSGMVVLNFTVGTTILQCFYRVVATVIGAVWGYIALLAVGRHNPYILMVMVCIFAVPFWYIFLGSRHPRIGMMALLTLAVIVNTGYIKTYNETVFEIAYERTLTAVIAIVVVMIINWSLWPMLAREHMRLRMVALFVDAGIYYSQVASLACQPDVNNTRWIATERDALASGKTLRKRADRVAELLAFSTSEPRIARAPFPYAQYQDLLAHTRNVLYWTNNMLSTQRHVSKTLRRELMVPVAGYRKEMAAAVHLYLFTLAGSLSTKTALPASLPRAELARQNLQRKLSGFYRSKARELRQLYDTDTSGMDTKEPYTEIYWQAYAAGSVEVIHEMKIMADTVISLMGQHVFKTAEQDWTTENVTTPT
ncbi:hypothetical protein BZG36_00115 [Bifiguratus adelaidae]|uniref:ER transporter 6TM N-terminal domain-containing protein n=1 Tax=Bifiguratus adelaidae TaxID=1938954 RepID=A0A261Y8T5_9FUNG|nr:hypothetical protein BZG36_00115 [Bifiguratus adelaidae]